MQIKGLKLIKAHSNERVENPSRQHPWTKFILETHAFTLFKFELDQQSVL